MLVLQDVINLTKGAVRIREEDGFFCFYRFTDAQTAVMIDRKFPPHQFSTAGIRLEFLTKGGNISFDYIAVPGSGLTFYEFDITLDGINIYHVLKDELPYSGRVELSIPQRMTPSRVVIYLSNISCIRLKNISLPEDRIPVDRPTKLLMTGDSITHGYDAHHTNLSYANLTADLLNAELLNQGVGGDSFCAENIDPALPFQPDIVTVAYGTNDWYGGRLLRSGEARRYLDKLTAVFAGIPVLLLLPLWRSGEEVPRDGFTLEDGRAYLRTLAADYENVTAVEHTALVPALPEFYADGLHPNDLGFVYYAYHLAEIIKETLKK